MKCKNILALLFVFLLSSGVNVQALSAQSAVLIDAATGRVLFSHNDSKPLPMASTTKIMTALVAIEKGNPDDLVTVSANAACQEGTSMYLKAGQQITLRELLYGLLLSSGNDAAVAIAEHISGSTEEFAKLMTDRAREIGAVQTVFKNPNGLDAQGHGTTALELALITRTAMQNPMFAEIVKTKQITLENGTYTNHNKLLSMYEGVNGVKTGYTKRSGRCLVSSVERNGFSMIAVTLNDPDDWNDHIKLYNDAYNNYQLVTPVTKGNGFGKIKVAGSGSVNLLYGDDLHFYLNLDEQKRLEIINDVAPDIDPPVYKGQSVGTVSAYLDGTLLGKCGLVAADDVFPPATGQKSFMNNLHQTFIWWLGAFRR